MSARSGPVRVHPPHGTVIACEHGASRYAVDLWAGRHHLLADEPVEAGGSDLGPNPYELLASALAACTTMTLRMYADLKGWPVRRISVAVTHHKIHARDCVDCETREGWVDVLERVIELDGDLSEEQRERLLEIANRCPVHRTLTGEIRIQSRLARVPAAGDADG